MGGGWVVGGGTLTALPGSRGNRIARRRRGLVLAEYGTPNARYGEKLRIIFPVGCAVGGAGAGESIGFVPGCEASSRMVVDRSIHST